MMNVWFANVCPYLSCSMEPNWVLNKRADICSTSNSIHVRSYLVFLFKTQCPKRVNSGAQLQKNFHLCNYRKRASFWSMTFHLDQHLGGFRLWHWRGMGGKTEDRLIRAPSSHMPVFPQAVLNLSLWDRNQTSAITLTQDSGAHNHCKTMSDIRG